MTQSTKEIVSVPQGQHYNPIVSQAVKANGFLFLAAQRGVDPASNKVTTPDTGAQVRQILENMKAVLESQGGSLNDVVRTAVYLKNYKDRSAINPVWTEYFGNETPPTRFAVQVADIYGPGDYTSILVDAIALAPEHSGAKEVVHVSAGQHHYPMIAQAVKANGFLFLSAQRGVDPGTGKVMTPDTGAQSRQILENVKAVLESLGLSLKDVVRTGVFMKNLSERAALNPVWSEYFGHEMPPTRFAVEVADIFGPDDPSSILLDAIALAPERQGTKEIVKLPSGQRHGQLGAHVQKANGFLFFPAQRGVDPISGHLVSSDTAAQARQILENMKTAMESLGGSMNDVVKTGVYLKNMADRPAMNVPWGEYFGQETPPTRFAVQVADVPEDSGILIDAMAVAPR